VASSKTASVYWTVHSSSAIIAMAALTPLVHPHVTDTAAAQRARRARRRGHRTPSPSEPGTLLGMTVDLHHGVVHIDQRISAQAISALLVLVHAVPVVMPVDTRTTGLGEWT
jgi:uncharacterized protein with FMN-binding domain